MFIAATVATHKTAQQITVAEVAGVAGANAVKPLIFQFLRLLSLFDFQNINV